MKFVQSTLFGLGSIVAFVAIAGNASAAKDGKVFNGMMCVERFDSTPEIRYGNQGEAYNSAASSNPWGCPVVRDIMSSTMDIFDWDVTVDRNGNTGDSWDITLWSLNYQGTSGYTSTITVSSPDGIKKIDGGAINSAFTEGQIFISSTVPAGAAIHSYHIEEESN